VKPVKPADIVAEERAVRLRREVCDAIHEYTVSGDARRVADDLRRAVDEYDAAEEVDDEGRLLRAPACLALDAAELSLADAVARDLGAQHG